MKPPARLWARRFSPQYHWAQVPEEAVQQALRTFFETWGRPERMRVDNGKPWGTWSDTPPALALWLIGLGIDPIWNHAHCPKENTFVERCHGVVANWGEPKQCANFAAWKEKVAWVAKTQRERYPGVGGRTRLEAYPKLKENPRGYVAEAEERLFQIERVREYLAEGRWPRRVSQRGQITIYSKPYEVGRRYGGQRVWVRLDARENEWVLVEDDGPEIRRHPAQQITAERIRTLKVAHPRAPSKKRKRHNLPPPTAAKPSAA